MSTAIYQTRQVIKYYKCRLYPNKGQEEFLQKQFDGTLWLYNYFLTKHHDDYEAGRKPLNKKQMGYHLTSLRKTEPSIEGVPRTVAESAIVEIKQAFQAFFDRYKSIKKKTKGTFISRERFGYPKLKEPWQANHATFHNHHYSKTIYNSIEIADGKLKLPGLYGHFHNGESQNQFTVNDTVIKIVVSQPIEGPIWHVAVKRVPSGKYFAFICCPVEIPDVKKAPEKRIGLDMGLTDLITTSDGEKIPNPYFYERDLERIRVLSRRLLKKKFNSSNFHKVRKQLAKVHERIRNRKKDFLDKLTTRLVREYDFIGIETLNILGMVKNRCLSRRIAGTNWGECITMLEYKGDWYGTQVVKAGRNFASTKICSVCGHRNDNLTLRHREWKCPSCGFHHDRDINAAINILRECEKTLDISD